MMQDRKTVFKFYTIPQYRQEEAFLSSMNEKGWRFTGVTFPGLYHFEACEPGQVAYRLDYNQDGARNKAEYIQMFSDCGWEYLCDFVGYSYFRKEGEVGEEREEIFCDDESRLDMMRRVFRGRIIPLILLFVFMILPQLFRTTIGHGMGGVLQDVFSYMFLGLALIYLVIFTFTAFQFFKYERLVTGDRPGVKAKYAAVFALIAVFLIGIVGFFWYQNYSDYKITENADGYSLDAERLNTSVAKAYDLKKGDTVVYHITKYERGCIHLSLKEENKEPVFYGDFDNTGYHTVDVLNDGHYLIGIAGRKAVGDVDVVIRKDTGKYVAGE